MRQKENLDSEEEKDGLCDIKYTIIISLQERGIGPAALNNMIEANDYLGLLPRELMNRLVIAHPRLFRGRHPRTQSEICAGWYPFVFEMCSAIEKIIVDEGIETFEVFQVKEKFGGLRFYVGVDESEAERITSLIRAAEATSYRTCMECGAEAVDKDSILLTRRRCAACSSD